MSIDEAKRFYETAPFICFRVGTDMLQVWKGPRGESEEGK